MPLTNGQILQGRYRIISRLGQGGMGAVYLADDMRLTGRRCAIKENIPDPNASPQALARIRRQFHMEASTLATLDHPNLPKVSDYFSHAGNEYIVMDYVEGDDLESTLKRHGGPLPEKPVLIWADQVLDALEYLHSRQPNPIIHRDIKPANIVLTPQGKIKLVDFGLVKLLDPSDPRTATVMKGMGTPEYTPLEQYASGPGHTDARSDIYSLGATLYHLLTDVAPLDAPQRLLNPMKLAPPRHHNPGLSAETEAAVLKAMEIYPDRRFQTAKEMRESLAGQRRPAVRSLPPQPAVGGFQTPRWLLAMVGGALLLLAAIIALLPSEPSPKLAITPTTAVVAPEIPIVMPAATPVPPTETPNPPTATPVLPTKIKTCLVTDVGGINDKSFNATAWRGVQDAIDQLDVEGQFLESQEQADYAKNIQEFLDGNCDLIVTVGFLLGDATKEAANANPDQKFAIVDFAYAPEDIPANNVLGLTFNTAEAAFLAGYLSAGMTQTGNVGTFGGINIPPVTVFMDGFAWGVRYYNKVHGTDVQVLGWDPDAQDGLFTGNFESLDDGRTFAESLFDEGADIVLPVAGPVGLGSAAAVQERGMMLIGVDTDWYVSAPEYRNVELTSILKHMDVAVYDATKSVVEGTFEGGIYVGTLSNNGVGIAPYHEFEDDVPAFLKEELDRLRQAIINGGVKVGP